MSPDALVHPIIRQATVADAARLAVLARDTFVDTFGPENTAADMAMYVAANFGEDLQRAELLDARNTVFVIEVEGELAAYVMLREGAPSIALEFSSTIEIDRLY